MLLLSHRPTLQKLFRTIKSFRRKREEEVRKNPSTMLMQTLLYSRQSQRVSWRKRTLEARPPRWRVLWTVWSPVEAKEEIQKRKKQLQVLILDKGKTLMVRSVTKWWLNFRGNCSWYLYTATGFYYISL